MPTKIQLRRDNATGLAAAGAITLSNGEPFVLDGELLKIGDGTNTFAKLASFAPNSHISVLTSRKTSGLNQTETIFGGGLILDPNTVYEIEYQLIGRFISNGTNLTLSVANLISPFNDRILESVKYATTDALGTAGNLAVSGAVTTTYSNGTSGVGATLTLAITAGTWVSPLVIDGVTPLTVGDRILIKNQANSIQNGIYTLTSTTATGGGSTGNFVFTRATDNDQVTEILKDDEVYISDGDENGDDRWRQTATVTAVGTSNITWAQYTGSVASFGSFVKEWTCNENRNVSGYENLGHFASISSDSLAPQKKDAGTNWQSSTPLQPAGLSSGRYFFTYKVKGTLVVGDSVTFNPRFSLSNTSHIKYFFLYSGSYIKATVLGPTSLITRSGNWQDA